jgi:hypothetical protein
MRRQARDRIEGALSGVAAAALVGLLACSSEPKKDVAIPVDTPTRVPVDTSVLTVDGPGRVATAGPAADAGVRTDAGGVVRTAPRTSPVRDARDTDRKDSDKDSDRKDSDKKKGKGKKSR